MLTKSDTAPLSTSPDLRARVREQVTQARQTLAARTLQANRDGAADGQQDFVRQYLRFLSMQAVGKFTETLNRLAGGLDMLSRRASDMQIRIAHNEQDMLRLVAALERVHDLPDAVAALEARVARAEAGLATTRERPAAGDATLPAFITAAGRQLRQITAMLPSGGHAISLGTALPGWLDAVAQAGFRAAESTDEQLATLPLDGADLLTALFTFDAMPVTDARRTLGHCRRALHGGGALFLVTSVLPMDTRPAWLTSHDPRLTTPSDLANLLRESGFDRVSHHPLDVVAPVCHVVIGRRR
jgi:hypothetical protein